VNNASDRHKTREIHILYGLNGSNIPLNQVDINNGQILNISHDMLQHIQLFRLSDMMSSIHCLANRLADS
jgi:hypothetical protein